MRLVRDYKDYELNEFESKSELDEYIEVNQGVLINANCEDKKKFYEIRISSAESVIVGIVGGGHGIEPSALIANNFGCILIGIDKKVYCLGLKDSSLRWVMDFDSIVYEIMKTVDSSFLVICELGVVSITSNGDRLWEHTSDVVTDFKLEKNTLRLSTDEGEYSLALDNGNVI